MSSSCRAERSSNRSPQCRSWTPPAIPTPERCSPPHQCLLPRPPPLQDPPPNKRRSMSKILSDLPFTLTALRDAYAAGVTPAEVMTEVLARLDAVQDPAIFIHLASAEDLAAEAAALGAYDPDRPLWGVPFAVKDNIDVAGCQTTAACPDYAFMAEDDAACVRLLKDAGAIVIGKTNLDQFATGLVGVRTPYPVPRNAVDEKLVPGGSSSGSAVAVARGIVSFALGTDTAGSGRVPAALNGI